MAIGFLGAILIGSLINAAISAVGGGIKTAIESAQEKERLEYESELAADELDATIAAEEETLSGWEEDSENLTEDIATMEEEKSEALEAKAKENTVNQAAMKYNLLFSGVKLDAGSTPMKTLENYRKALSEEYTELGEDFTRENIQPLRRQKEETQRDIDYYSREGGYLDQLREQQTALRDRFNGNTFLDNWGFRWLNPYRQG